MTEAEILESLSLYLAAERKILEGNQSWNVGGVTYTRASLALVQGKIAELRQQLTIVQNQGSYGCQGIVFGGRR